MEHSPGWNTSEGAFDDLTSLEYLTLSANRLTELNEGVFDNITDVKHLYFSRNRLASRPEGAFDGLSELNYLSIYRNRLTELADSVVADLDTLPVSFNRLSELPDDVLGGLDDLDLLNLGDNQLTELPDGLLDDLHRDTPALPNTLGDAERHLAEVGGNSRFSGEGLSVSYCHRFREARWKRPVPSFFHSRFLPE